MIANQVAGLLAPTIPPVILGDYESIATVTVGAGGSSSIDFTSIANTYKHLQIRGIGRSSESGSNNSGTSIQFNGDTATNYSWHVMYGGSSVGAVGFANTNLIGVGEGTGAAAGANTFGGFVIDILDYANTNKYKTVRTLNGWENNGTGTLLFVSGAWRNTNAVTSIKLTTGGSGFVQYSQFALYGVK